MKCIEDIKKFDLDTDVTKVLQRPRKNLKKKAPKKVTVTPKKEKSNKKDKNKLTPKNTPKKKIRKEKTSVAKASKTKDETSKQ